MLLASGALTHASISLCDDGLRNFDESRQTLQCRFRTSKCRLRNSDRAFSAIRSRCWRHGQYALVFMDDRQGHRAPIGARL